LESMMVISLTDQGIITIGISFQNIFQYSF
jgi:hypothetical protein